RVLAVDPAQRFGSMQALLAVMEAQIERTHADALDVLPTRAVIDELAGMGSTSVVALDLPGLRDGVSTLGPRLPAVQGETGAGASAETRALALPPEDDGGVVTSVATRRSLPGLLDESTVKVLLRELDRLGGRRGKVAKLGPSVAWSTRELEVHIDPSARGTQLLVWRRLDRTLRR